VYPYDGVDFFLGTAKIGSDNFDVTANPYKLSFLSTQTNYFNTTNAVTGIPPLVAAATGNVIGSGLITNPGVDIYRGTVTPSTTPDFDIPLANQNLYLIYDFRVTTVQQLCYDASSAVDACCDCSVTCTGFSAGTLQSNAASACVQPLVNTYYFLNQSTPLTYPEVGTLVYSSTDCDTNTPLVVGFYRIATGFIQVNSQGIVIQVGNC